MRWRRLRALFELHPAADASLEAPDDEAFLAHARALTLRNARLTALGVTVAALVCVVLDRVLFRGSPEIARPLLAMRLAHAASGALFYLAMRGSPSPRAIVAAPLAFVAIAAAILGIGTGSIGGLAAPWFHFTYVAVVGIVLPMVPLGHRAAYGIALSGSLCAGFAAARPLGITDPMVAAALTFLAFITVAALLAGEAIYRLVRRAFHSGRQRDRAARTLEALNRTLEQRVREQTQELRLLTSHLEGARERERAHVARELHDELGQELTALRYALTFTRQRFERDPGSIRGNLGELDSLLARTATTTRKLITDLRPRILDDLGLDAGVEWLVQRTEERGGLRCRLETSCRSLDVDADISIAAFRILQESLTNVVRHAQASQVDVAVVVHDRELRLRVHDDGVGLPEGPVQRLPGKGGMGLLGIRERVDALGGVLRLDSSPGRGTTVDVRLPLDAPVLTRETAR
ncbi:Sensory box histidine kinase [Minicystis rosea]|nr:Sensory box histidine kinase [Minicystis rosea]